MSGDNGAAAAPGMTGIAQNQAPQSASSWYTPLIHGGGNQQLSKDDLMSLNNINNLSKDPSQDPAVLQQLAAQRAAIMNKDNGGYLGAFGRIATGAGQNGGEQLAGQGLNLIADLLRSRAVQGAFKNSMGNMQGAQQQVLAGQRGMLGKGF